MNERLKIGTTTFGFRYLLLDPDRAPAIETIFQQARAYGLDVLQICENARPMDLSGERWNAAVAHAADLGLEIQLGCKTLNLDVFEGYLRRAAALPARFLRLVLEEECGGPPQRSEVEAFLAAAFPLLEQTGTTLAIENHFDVPSWLLAEVVAPYPPSRVGFCIDTANSLRNFESPERVMECLGDRALCYHVKDFQVGGDKLGFTVSGAPLGEGRLDLDGLLCSVLKRNRAPRLFIENWVPATGVSEADIRQDDEWLRTSLHALVDHLTAKGFAGVAHPVRGLS